MPERKYSPAELAAILRAAAEVQSEGFSTGDENAVYSLADIERVAAEVGIDPQNVKAALVRTQSPSKSKWAKLNEFSILDNSTGLTVTRTFNSKIDDFQWMEILGEFRKIFRGTGNSSSSGSTREWKNQLGAMEAHVFATEKDGSTRIQVLFGATPIYQGLVTSVVCGGMAFSSVLGTLLIVLSFLVHAYILIAIGLTCALIVLQISFGAFIRSAIGSVTKKDRAKVEALMEKTETMLAVSVESPVVDQNATIQTQNT